jgi:hypothetical protein
MEKYTVATSMPSGKSDPKFGTEYIVKFAENEGTFKLWYKKQPEEGFVQEGTIDGWKFIKAKKEYVAGAAGSVPAAVHSVSKPTYRDNSDGMRKGMAINNAAAYVMATSQELYSPQAWAKRVADYARELYLVSELEPQTQEETPAPVDRTTEAKKVFGV